MNERNVWSRERERMREEHDNRADDRASLTLALAGSVANGRSSSSSWNKKKASLIINRAHCSLFIHFWTIQEPTKTTKRRNCFESFKHVLGILRRKLIRLFVDSRLYDKSPKRERDRHSIRRRRRRARRISSLKSSKPHQQLVVVVAGYIINVVDVVVIWKNEIKLSIFIILQICSASLSLMLFNLDMHLYI